jgi:glycosyltransferase involved in cell wall biosynthesis
VDSNATDVPRTCYNQFGNRHLLGACRAPRFGACCRRSTTAVHGSSIWILRQCVCGSAGAFPAEEHAYVAAMTSPRKAHRIALVISQLRPGGAERVVVHLANRYAALGLGSLVVCMEQEGELAAELTSNGVRVVALHSARSYDLSALLRFRRVLKDFDASVVHVHDYASLPYAAMATWLSARRLFFTAHGLLYEGFDRLQRRHKRFAQRLTSIAAVSDEVATRHRNYLDWRGEISVIPNGIPGIERSASTRSELRREFGIPEHAFVFLAVGNARPEKAFDVLIHANETLQATKYHTECHVLIAGRLSDDDYCRQLRQLAAASQAPGLHLLGFRTDSARLYACADAFVISSRSEGLPLVLLEAMNAGLPIIATRVGGIPRVVSSEFGLLVDPDQPTQLAEAMARTMNMNAAARTEMARVAHEIAETQYGVGRMAANYLDFYDAALGQLP